MLPSRLVPRRALFGRPGQGPLWALEPVLTVAVQRGPELQAP
ncbi:hypothetical protein AB07_3221 [Citrobacter freundii]|nr:hypothetical protein AB07_3221 [Citrobacter freundii]